MLAYIQDRIRNIIINRRHPELQSGKILDFEHVCQLHNAYSRNHTIENPISPVGKKEIGYSGSNAELVDIFKGIELGTWAIDSRTIDWLWDFLSTSKPNAILEFGSGSPTCLFSAWMQHYNKSGMLISVEQHRSEAEKTSARLREHGIASNGRVLCMDTDAAGRIIVDCDKILHELNGRKIDMLFSDGPAGPVGCRANTLTDSMPLFAQSGHWFLHDSYRIGELGIIKEWENVKGVAVGGILASGNGLGIGRWDLQ